MISNFRPQSLRWTAIASAAFICFGIVSLTNAQTAATGEGAAKNKDR